VQTYLDTPDIRPHDLTVCVNIEWLVGGYDQPSFPEELNAGDIMVFPVHDPGISPSIWNMFFRRPNIRRGIHRRLAHQG